MARPETARVLFLCTGNYYRSRFAEVLFNALAEKADLDWVADSRGLAPHLGANNIGPISLHTLQGLDARGISIETPVRSPMPVRKWDLEEANLVIALKEAEHRPLLEEHFSEWPDEVEYWHVDDLDVALPEDTLVNIERCVTGLIERLCLLRARIGAISN
jgi:protein-tyrosine phosphatase